MHTLAFVSVLAMPLARGKQIDYVLGNFSQSEMAELTTLIDKAVDMTLSFCTIGIENTMTRFN